MTLLIAALGAAAIVLFVVTALWFRRNTALLIPVLFAVLFWGALHAIDYLGYAVDARHLDGREAVVIDAIEGSEWIYLLVRAGNDREPRLVRVPATEQNRKDAEEARQQAENGLTVIRFGRGARPDAPLVAAAGEESEPGFEIVNLEDTESYGKTQAAELAPQ